MSPEKLEAIKKVISFGIELKKAIKNAMSDGKFEPADLFFFKDVMFGAPVVYTLLPLVHSGIKDASQNDLNELQLFFSKEFDLENDKVEEIIEESLKVVISLFGLAQKIKG